MLLALRTTGWISRRSCTRIHTARRARERVEELSGEGWVNADTAVRLRGLYEWRYSRFRAQAESDGTEYDTHSEAYQRLLSEVLEGERQTLLELRNEGRITDEMMRRVEATSISRRAGSRPDRCSRCEQSPNGLDHARYCFEGGRTR